MADANFPRQARLQQPAEFRRVFAEPVKATCGGLVALATPNDCGHARLGLAISRRKLRRAHARNRLKRVIRESFRQRRHELGGIDVVVLPRHGIDPSDPRVHGDAAKLWELLRQRCKIKP
jgi:ribonuclease P protein component